MECQLAKIGIGGGLGLFAAVKSFFLVDSGHRALKFNSISGLNNKVYDEGAHFKVDIGICILVRPDVNMLPTIYRSFGKTYETVLPFIVTEAVKSVIEQHNANHIIQEQELVDSKIFESVMEKAASYNIIVEHSYITKMSLEKEFTAAVEAEQVAQALLERAQGEAGELIDQANQFFVAIRKIEAEKEIAKITSQNRIEANQEIANQIEGRMSKIIDLLHDIKIRCL